MEPYTTLVSLVQRPVRPGGADDGQSGMTTEEEPSRAEILVAIQGSRVALESKIETVAVEVNLVRVDPRKVSDKVKVAKGSIVELQTEAARDSYKAGFENGKISIYPDHTNKVQNSQKSFLEVKVKLWAMNDRYMLLYLVRLKLLSGGRSHFFEHPEEVWRWLEMCDKAALGNLAGTGGVVHRASKAEDPDWRIRGGGLSENTVARRRTLPSGLRYNMIGRWLWCLLGWQIALAEGWSWIHCWPPGRSDFVADTWSCLSCPLLGVGSVWERSASGRWCCQMVNGVLKGHCWRSGDAAH
ncbi:hypothetical protein NDU88_010710 [Pleurodeles waltl]|uniref:Uncharacterized protein n=1 Tax=Pleurodeles waltl TaxID=8319 RepID=A0AAV7QV50_PLEWA|nr:hypothetical protein NDU88_010710 [Pleurodeles waltl]